MAATTLDRNTARKYVERVLADDAQLAASTTIPAGVIVSADASGNLINATDTASTIVLGRAPRRMINTSGSPAKINPKAYVEAGVFKFGTTGGNALTIADIGKNACVLDNQTVVRAAGTTNSIVAGTVEAIDEDGGIWVKMGL